MRMGKKWVALVSSLVLGSAAQAAPVNTAPDLEYSQDGITYQPFKAVVGRQKVRNYYDYHGESGHPAFGTARATATAAVYYDVKRHALSLIVINGMARHGFRTAVGGARYWFAGLTPSTYLSVRDDPKDITYDAGDETASARFAYKSSSDGLVLSGLEDEPLEVRFSLSNVRDLDTWRLVDGNTGPSHAFIGLDPDKPLFLRSVNGVNTPRPPAKPPTSGSGGNVGGGGVSTPPLPEPGVLSIGAAAVIGSLAARRRRRP